MEKRCSVRDEGRSKLHPPEFLLDPLLEPPSHHFRLMQVSLKSCLWKCMVNIKQISFLFYDNLKTVAVIPSYFRYVLLQRGS